MSLHLPGDDRDAGVPYARVAVLGAALCALPSLALAQAKPFEPTVGQAGKDVVWVPTPQALVEKMLDLAKVTPQDFLMDLGSGDGRTVITAAKRGLRAQGVEYNPDMVELSKRNAAAAGVGDKANFVKADLFETDFSKAQVITMFLLPSINLRLRPTILNMKPGTRIVSNSFTMDDWQADQTTTVEGDCTTWCTAYLWIVPAKAEGTWQLGSERADADAEVPDAHGDARLQPAHERAPDRRRDHLLGRRRDLHGHRQRQLHEGHHERRHGLERNEEVLPSPGFRVGLQPGERGLAAVAVVAGVRRRPPPLSHRRGARNGRACADAPARSPGTASRRTASGGSPGTPAPFRRACS